MQKSAFKIINPGLLSLIQDAGRYGYAKLGITTGGPADSEAFNYANFLVGNPKGHTAIEISFGNIDLECQSNCQIAITGAKAKVTVNGSEHEQWQMLSLNVADKLHIGETKAGIRIYLAISGGFVTTPQLGSTSTVLREGLGGLDGAKLREGQDLYFTPPKKKVLEKPAIKNIPEYSNKLNLRVIKAYQHDLFECSQRALFFNSTYKVSDLADRMGYRLFGNAIKFSQTRMYSEGICAGAIQITADGQPIVMGKDRQTIGGYPKIGSLLSLDLDKLMQTGPGAIIRFSPIDIEDAHNLLHLTNCAFE